MSEILPKGWISTELGQIVLHRKGKKPESTIQTPKGGYVPYILIDEMEGKPTRSYTDDKTVPIAKGEDILIVWDGSIGKTATGLSGAIGSTIVALTPIIIPSNFLEAFLKLSKPTIEQTSRGTGLQHINQSTFWPLAFPLPPLNEQKRIVSKLDKIMPRIATVKDRLDKVPAIVKRFRQSVLTAACSGRLTESIEEYPVVPFCDLIKSIRGGTTSVPTNEFTNFPVLRSSSVRQGHIDLQDVKYLGREQSTNKDNFITNGDLLFTRLNGTAEYVGNCALVSGIQHSKYQYPDRLYCARLIDKISPAYCVIAFSLPEIRIDIENRAKSSAGHKRISISDIKEMNIPFPPLEEQKEIVRQVDKLFALADRLESHYQKAKARVDKLSQSVLAKAFRGELVITESELAEKDGRNFESAEKLLERILEEKKSLSQSTRGTRRKEENKSSVNSARK